MLVSENLGRALAKADHAAKTNVAKMLFETIKDLKSFDGQERIKRAYELMDDAVRFELRENPDKEACHKGCAHCCYMSVDIFDGEADLLASMIESGQVKIDKKEFDLQKTMSSDDYLRNPRPCIFLKQNDCQVYENRPLACRKYYVTGNRRKCIIRPRKRKKVKILFLPGAEIIYSAMVNTAPFKGNATLAHMIDKRLGATN